MLRLGAIVFPIRLDPADAIQLALGVGSQSALEAVNPLVPEEVNQSVREEGKPSTEIGRRDSTQIRCARMTITGTPVVELAADCFSGAACLPHSLDVLGKVADGPKSD